MTGLLDLTYLVDSPAGFSEAARQGEFDHTDPTLEKLLGRKPVSVREYLKGIYG